MKTANGSALPHGGFVSLLLGKKACSAEVGYCDDVEAGRYAEGKGEVPCSLYLNMTPEERSPYVDEGFKGERPQYMQLGNYVLSPRISFVPMWALVNFVSYETKQSPVQCGLYCGPTYTNKGVEYKVLLSRQQPNKFNQMCNVASVAHECLAGEPIFYGHGEPTDSRGLRIEQGDVVEGLTLDGRWVRGAFYLWDPVAKVAYVEEFPPPIVAPDFPFAVVKMKNLRLMSVDGVLQCRLDHEFLEIFRENLTNLVNLLKDAAPQLAELSPGPCRDEIYKHKLLSASNDVFSRLVSLDSLRSDKRLAEGIPEYAAQVMTEALIPCFPTRRHPNRNLTRNGNRTMGAVMAEHSDLFDHIKILDTPDSPVRASAGTAQTTSKAKFRQVQFGPPDSVSSFSQSDSSEWPSSCGQTGSDTCLDGSYVDIDHLAAQEDVVDSQQQILAQIEAQRLIRAAATSPSLAEQVHSGLTSSGGRSTDGKDSTLYDELMAASLTLQQMQQSERQLSHKYDDQQLFQTAAGRPIASRRTRDTTGPGGFPDIYPFLPPSMHASNASSAAQRLAPARLVLPLQMNPGVGQNEPHLRSLEHLRRLFVGPNAATHIAQSDKHSVALGAVGRLKYGPDFGIVQVVEMVEYHRDTFVRVVGVKKANVDVIANVRAFRHDGLQAPDSRVSINETTIELAPGDKVQYRDASKDDKASYYLLVHHKGTVLLARVSEDYEITFVRTSPDQLVLVAPEAYGEFKDVFGQRLPIFKPGCRSTGLWRLAPEQTAMEKAPTASKDIDQKNTNQATDGADKMKEAATKEAATKSQHLGPSAQNQAGDGADVTADTAKKETDQQ